MESDKKINTTSVFTNEELQFFNIIALSNYGSKMLLFSDQSFDVLMTILAVFHSTTQHDIIIHTHIYNYTHIQYLQLLRTLHSNPPMDLSTYVVYGNNALVDVEVHEDNVIDVIFLYYKSLVSLSSLIPSFWKKLKSNGTLIIKGIEHDNKTGLLELQVLFGNIIPMPAHIRVNIHLIESTKDILIIKKPCY